jgi:Na+/melibiose symporter-like transporter
MLISVFPTITFLVGVACLFFYAIDKKMEVKLESELSERRKTKS